MDAYKPENFSTDSDNTSSDLFDMESTVLAQDGTPDLDALLGGEDDSNAQSLEEEFSDLTQKAASHQRQSDIGALETDSDIDFDQAFAEFQTSQQAEDKSSSDLMFDSQSMNIDELLLDEAFEVSPSAENEGTEAIAELAELLGTEEDKSSDVVLDLEMDSEPDLMAAPSLEMPTETDVPSLEAEPEALEAPVESDMATEEAEPEALEMVADLESLEQPEAEGSTEEVAELSLEASQEEISEEALPSEPDVSDVSVALNIESSQAETTAAQPEMLDDQEEPELSLDLELDLEMDSEPDLVSAPTLGSSDAEDEPELQTLDEALDLSLEETSEDETGDAIAHESDEAVIEEPVDTAQDQDRIQELETLLQQNQIQIEELQTLVNSKIDPEIHTHLLQELRQYKGQVADLEASLKTLEEEQQEAQSAAPSAEYEALQQLVDEQKQTIAELQETITKLKQEVSNWQTQAEAKIDYTDFEVLHDQSTAQAEMITKLEAQVQSLQAEYEQSQQASSQKVEPADYQAAQAEAQSLAAQVQDWEQRYASLSAQLEEQTQLASYRIDPETHASLNQTLEDYSTQINTLQSEKAELEQAVKTWQSKADAKIEPSEYEAVLEQLQRLKEKNARSLWARIVDWFMGK